MIDTKMIWLVVRNYGQWLKCVSANYHYLINENESLARSRGGGKGGEGRGVVFEFCY